jgi:6-pyruvoyltetrahydropterin/6-carboxytetrahydropterin synthase
MKQPDLKPFTCTRRIQFCAGHRVPLHESKCRHPHGHNYVALLTAEADRLDEAGRVVDFSVLKQRIGGWIDLHWDHGTILQTADREMRAALTAFTGVSGFDPKVYYMDDAPTAENMAQEILRECGSRLEGTGCRLVRVELWETENCYAVAEVD